MSDNTKPGKGVMLAVIGLLGAAIAAPVAVWRSTKLGRRLSFLLLIAMLLWTVGKAADVYFEKWQKRLMLNKIISPIKTQLDDVQTSLDEARKKVSGIDKAAMVLLESSTESAFNPVRARINEINKSLESVESTISAIKKDQRQAVKERIIKLRESVIVHKRSIEESVVRLECEEIVDNLSVLSDKERDRFYTDLDEIGFQIKRERENIVRIIADGYSMVSCDSVASYRATTRDAVVYYGGR